MKSAILFLITVMSHLNAEYIPPGPKYTCPSETEKLNYLYPCICVKGTDDGLFIECQNVGLAKLSVGLGNIASLGMPIESLNLKECPISNLHGTLFHRTQIRILNITDSPIDSMDPYIFLGVNQTLHELNMIHTKLHTFPKEAFKILGNLISLTIDGHYIKVLDKDIMSGSEMANRVERIRIINGNITDISDLAFMPARKLKVLDLHGNQIQSLKKNQFKGLRETELLDLSYNRISKLEGVHLADLTKLGWLNVSHNSIGEITRGMFARNTILKVLHLNSNKIRRLDTNSFRGMRFLRRLYLQDNEISDVGRSTFGAINHIGTIDLSGNKITKIDYQMFYQLNYIEIINLSRNAITEIQKQAFKDLYLTNINLSRNNISKVESGAFENCANMTILDMSYNQLTNLSKTVFDPTTYATELQLSYNKFTDLSQVPIHNMTGLKIMNVSHNDIITIPRNTFPKLYELHTVDVSYNNLTSIASAVFQTLFSLRYLNLSHNSMEIIKPPTFGTLPTVLQLDLSYNKLSDVSRGSLAKLPSCSVIDVSHNSLERIFQIPISLSRLLLSNNKINDIPANTWPSMNSLLHLDLSVNSIGDTLTDVSFVGLLTLQRLDLSSNGLTRPPWEALNTLSSLQYLHLNSNNLTVLNRAAFGRLPIVFELDLSHNQLTNISQKSFDGMLQLITLDLSHNNIKYIPNEAFKGLVAMRNLDLTHNNLEKIDNRTNGLLDDCLSIQTVNLSYNSISSLTRKMFPSNIYIPYKLQSVDMSHNQLSVLTYDITFGTKRLQTLNLSYNTITDIRKDVLGNLTSLIELDLSGNKLTDLQTQTADSKLKLPLNLTILNVSSNELDTLPIKQLVELKYLKYLDVTNNMLEYIDSKLVDRIKHGNLQLLFKGNPLRCDCQMLPLRQYINQLPKSISSNSTFSTLMCHSPGFLTDQLFVDVPVDRFVCNDVTRTNDDTSYMFEVESDLAFRDVKFSQTKISIQWFILGSGDIADFYLYIRDSRNSIYFEEDIPYNKRKSEIDIQANPSLKDEIYNKNRENSLEICIQAKTSSGKPRKWYPSQCKPMPTNFKDLKVNLSNNYGGYVGSGSSVLMLVSDTVLLVVCVFLSILS